MQLCPHPGLRALHEPAVIVGTGRPSAVFPAVSALWCGCCGYVTLSAAEPGGGHDEVVCRRGERAVGFVMAGGAVWPEGRV